MLEAGSRPEAAERSAWRAALLAAHCGAGAEGCGEAACPPPLWFFLASLLMFRGKGSAGGSLKKEAWKLVAGSCSERGERGRDSQRCSG